MKGCLAVVGIVALLLILVVGGILGFAVYKGKQFAEEFESAYAEIEATNSEFPFTAPDGAMPPDRFAEFIDVRGLSVGPIETAVADMKKLEDMENQGKGGFGDVKEAFGAMGRMVNAFVEVPKKLAEELRGRQMSYDEFLWFEETVHGTLAAAAKQGNEDAIALVDAMEESTRDSNAKVNDKNMRYSDVRRSMEERFSEFDPANLALIVERGPDLTEPTSRIILDIFVLQQFRQGGNQFDSIDEIEAQVEAVPVEAEDEGQ